MTLFSALAILRVNRRSCDLSCLLTFTAASAALGFVRNGMLRRDLYCRVFIAGGAAAALASWSLVLLAGGPLTVSIRTLSLFALLVRLGSALAFFTAWLRLLLCLSITLGADWLLPSCSWSILLCLGSVVLDLVLYWWWVSTLGAVGWRFGLALSALAFSSMLRAPSTSLCSSCASVDASCPPNPLIVLTTLRIAIMTLSAFVMDGLVIRLCLKLTVSEKLSFLVSFMWHVWVR